MQDSLRSRGTCATCWASRGGATICGPCPWGSTLQPTFRLLDNTFTDLKHIIPGDRVGAGLLYVFQATGRLAPSGVLRGDLDFASELPRFNCSICRSHLHATTWLPASKNGARY